MNTKGDGAEYKRRVEKKNDFHFIEHWKEGEHFDWHANWEPLNACIHDFRIIDTFQVCEGDLFDLERDLTKSTPAGKKDDVSEEERE